MREGAVPPLSGRREKRVAERFEVELSRRDNSLTRERTFTENTSPGGTRVLTTRPWQPQDQVIVYFLQGGFPVRRAEVVYCEHLGDRFAIGLEWVVQRPQRGKPL